MHALMNASACVMLLQDAHVATPRRSSIKQDAAKKEDKHAARPIPAALQLPILESLKQNEQVKFATRRCMLVL
jgi:hypothetical protein